MRTTVTLDPDTDQLVRRRMRERGLSFKQALNELIRQGAGAPTDASLFRTETASLGTSSVNLDRALQVVADLEDDELIRRMRTGS
jgi:type II secretory pathway component PulF